MVLLVFEGGVHRLADDAVLVATGVHACRGRICIFVVAGGACPGVERELPRAFKRATERPLHPTLRPVRSCISTFIKCSTNY